MNCSVYIYSLQLLLETLSSCPLYKSLSPGSWRHLVADSGYKSQVLYSTSSLLLDMQQKQVPIQHLLQQNWSMLLFFAEPDQSDQTTANFAINQAVLYSKCEGCHTPWSQWDIVRMTRVIVWYTCNHPCTLNHLRQDSSQICHCFFATEWQSRASLFPKERIKAYLHLLFVTSYNA